MTRIRRRLSGVLALSLGMTVLLAGTTPAKAQWGPGWGWGIFGVQPSASTNMINQHALNRASAVGNRSRSHSAYSSSSNAYFNRARDNGFVPHYDVRRRRASSYQPQPAASLDRSNRVEPQPEVAAPAAVLPLRSFFDASLKLVWPNESPTDGDLKEKREVADQATLAVLEETKHHGRASITSVADARQKLIAYGQPALQVIRAQATPPIADAFHRFLLALYDSLAEVASAAEAGQ